MNVDVRGMQQYVIPQFIDNENHVIGPITTRQFMILLATAGIIFLTYRLSDFTLFLILSVIWIILGIIVGFVRPNGRPFHFFLLNITQTTRRPNLRVWKKKATFEEIQDDIRVEKVTVSAAPVLVRRTAVPTSRLSDLSLVVDTGGVYRGEEIATKK